MGVKTPDHRLGGVLPSSLPQLCQLFAHLRYDYASKIGRPDFEAACQLPLNPQTSTFVDFPNVGYYAPFPYLFQALVLKLLMEAEARPLVLLYAGRLATLLLWLVLVVAALRLMPIFRLTLSWLLLLPASIFLHASLSGDALTNGLGIWLLAAMLSLALGKGKPTSLLVLGIFGSAAAMVLSKPVYFPLVLLAFGVPKTRFRQPAGYWLFSGGLLATCLILMGCWYSYAGQLFLPFEEYHIIYRENVQLNEGVQPQQQLRFVLAHPFAFLRAATLSFWESAPAIAAHYVGKFGWEKNYLPGGLIGVLWGGTLLLAFTDRRAGMELKRHHRLVLAAIGMTMSAGVALVIYLQWMPVGHSRILALNGRYFFLVFPCFFLAASGWANWQKNNQTVELWARLVSAASLLLGAWSVWLRYYAESD